MSYRGDRQRGARRSQGSLRFQPYRLAWKALLPIIPSTRRIGPNSDDDRRAVRTPNRPPDYRFAMPRRRCHHRPLLIAVAVILSALSAMTGGAGVGLCDPAQAPTSCCVDPPTSGPDCCLPSGTTPIRAAEGGAVTSLGLAGPGIACNPPACQCRPHEPVAPGPKQDRRAVDDRPDLGPGAHAEWLGPTLPPASTVPGVSSSRDRLKRPLGLLTTHLLF
jgi:hypothetical protein